MKFGEIVPKVLKTLRSPVGRMTSHPDVNSQSAPRLGHVRKKFQSAESEVQMQTKLSKSSFVLSNSKRNS